MSNTLENLNHSIQDILKILEIVDDQGNPITPSSHVHMAREMVNSLEQLTSLYKTVRFYVEYGNQTQEGMTVIESMECIVGNIIVHLSAVLQCADAGSRSTNTLQERIDATEQLVNEKHMKADATCQQVLDKIFQPNL